jgi:O-antigen ligase
VGVAVLGLAGAPAVVAAFALLLFVGTVTIRHPANGLAAIVLAIPFLLGEPKTVYFLLEPALVTLVLLSVLGHRLAGRIELGHAYAGALLTLIAAAVIALPLDLNELLEDLWLARSLDWATMSVYGIPDISHLKYLDRVVVFALAAGLVAVAAQPPLGPTVVAAIQPLAAVIGLLAAFGLVRLFRWIETRGEYLTLSFYTSGAYPTTRLTSVAWNPDYFALFLVMTIPPVLALAFVPGSRVRTRALAGAAAALGAVALVCTFQRAAYLALVAAVVVLVVLLRRVRRIRLARWLLAGAIWVVVVAALDALAFDGRVLGRLVILAEDDNRLLLWRTALRMALAHPILGVGTGRYAYFFREYAGDLASGFGPFWGTAHSLYLHLLAEQGLVGLTSFVVLFGGLWWTASRQDALDGSRAVAVAGLLAGLAGWLVYGVVQFTFRIPAVLYLVALFAGAVLALAPPAPRRLSRRMVLVGLAVALVLLGARTIEALRRPVTPGYELGFYHWERQADGSASRWTHGRAALSVPVGGSTLELAFRAPIPQRVRVWLDRRRAADLILATPEWRVIALPVTRASGEPLLVEVESGYTFVPSRVSSSRDDRRLGVMMGELRWR